MASRRVRKYKSLSNYLESLAIDTRESRIRNNYTGVGSEAIGASQLSEEVEVLDKSIQSSNYLSGEDGWRIDGSGNAEFGNVFVRGDINAESGTIGYWNISSPVVTRTFGTTSLFGTFLESYSHGDTDVDTDAGSYVALYKSYVDDPISFSGFSVESNKVTVTADFHQFAVDSPIVISYANTAYSTYEKNIYSPGTITDVTDTTFTYSIDTINETGLADVPFTEATGEAYIYIPDVAGLFLRDYERKDFSYGYFSNKGVKYASPDAVNFILNPSFEYGSIANNASIPSAGSWSTASGPVFSLANIAMLTQTRTGSFTGQFSRDSNFGANVVWSTTAPTNRLVSTVDYSNVIYYNKIYSGSKLYLNMGVFFDYQPSIAAGKNVASATYTNTASFIGNLTVTMSAATSTFFSAGDYVFLDFEGERDEVDMFNRVSANATSSSIFERIFRVLGTSGSNLYVDLGKGPAVEGATTGGVTLSSRVNHDGTLRPRRVHKAIYPKYGLSDIEIDVGGASNISLYDVLTDSSAEAWDRGQNKHYTIPDPTQYMDYLVDTSTAANVGSIITSLTPASDVDSDGVVTVDGKKLYDQYKLLNPVGLSNQNNISIKYPTWFYSGDFTNGNATTTNITANVITVGTLGAYFDNFNFGSFPAGFYGDTKNRAGSYAWGDETLAPNTISFAAGTEWISIDLATQDAIYDGVDYLGFSNQDYPHTLRSRAAITTYLGTSPTAFTAGGGSSSFGTGAIPLPGSDRAKTVAAGKSVDIGLFPSDSYYMRVDGGVLRNLDPDATTSNVKYLEYNSYINTILSKTSTGVEIAAKKYRVTYDPATDSDTVDTANTISASIIAYVSPEDIGEIIVKGRMQIEGGKKQATLTSTGHPFQIGLNSENNLRFSTYLDSGSAYSRIQSSNNGVGSRLYLNPDAGAVYIGVGDSEARVYIGDTSNDRIEIAGGPGTGGGTTFFGGNLSSDSTYDNEITTTRRAMWISSTGSFGYASSSRTKKQDIVSANLDVSSILSVDPVKFKYISAVKERGDAADVEIGFIAEDLHDAGLTEFVDYGKSGEPEGIHYQTYVVALQAVVREQQRQIDELSARIQNAGF